uniref:C2H2-type domain-containing protein n=1 Tax=Biomphalaria glabrata TaxID=6526 RepID=A0A2C9JT07_BIOGL
MKALENVSYLSSYQGNHEGRGRIDKARAAIHQLNTWEYRDISPTAKIGLFNTIVNINLFPWVTPSQASLPWATHLSFVSKYERLVSSWGVGYFRFLDWNDVPFFPYPGLLSATDELKYLSMAQIQAANQAHFVGELTKMKQPMLTKNYLELAMLVCNTFRGKLFPCPHCRYVTDRRNNLKRHVATMHQACDKQLECCGVTFATKASLREHITIFHHNGYSCPFCGRRFCRKALLKRHLSVHSGQKDYTCPHCDYATSHKSNLERHKRIHARLQIMGESGLEDIPRDVNAMFSESGLHSVESHISELERHAPVSQHCVHETEKHHWTDYRNEESVREIPLRIQY